MEGRDGLIGWSTQDLDSNADVDNIGIDGLHRTG